MNDMEKREFVARMKAMDAEEKALQILLTSSSDMFDELKRRTEEFSIRNKAAMMVLDGRISKEKLMELIDE